MEENFEDESTSSDNESNSSDDVSDTIRWGEPQEIENKVRTFLGGRRRYRRLKYLFS